MASDEWRVASGERNAEPTLLRYPPPLAFWQKRLQPGENKGSGHEKESKEKRRGGKLMKIRGLTWFATEAQRTQSGASGARGDTWGCGRRKGRDGDTVSRTLEIYYRIRYSLSSVK